MWNHSHIQDRLSTQPLTWQQPLLLSVNMEGIYWSSYQLTRYQARSYRHTQNLPFRSPTDMTLGSPPRGSGSRCNHAVGRWGRCDPTADCRGCCDVMRVMKAIATSRESQRPLRPRDGSQRPPWPSDDQANVIEHPFLIFFFILIFSFLFFFFFAFFSLFLCAFYFYFST